MEDTKLTLIDELDKLSRTPNALKMQLEEMGLIKTE